MKLLTIFGVSQLLLYLFWSLAGWDFQWFYRLGEITSGERIEFFASWIISTCVINFISIVGYFIYEDIKRVL